MTPTEMDAQIPPENTTRHAISVSLGQRLFYRDDVTPHQEWSGLTWSDLGSNGNCHPYTSLLSEAPYMHVSKAYSSGKQKLSPIYTDAKYKGD